MSYMCTVQKVLRNIMLTFLCCCFTGSMSCTVEKVLSDARLLVNRLKDHDGCADNVIGHSQTLLKRMEAMKQVAETMVNL